MKRNGKIKHLSKTNEHFFASSTLFLLFFTGPFFSSSLHYWHNNKKTGYGVCGWRISLVHSNNPSLAFRAPFAQSCGDADERIPTGWPQTCAYAVSTDAPYLIQQAHYSMDITGTQHSRHAIYSSSPGKQGVAERCNV